MLLRRLKFLPYQILSSLPVYITGDLREITKGLKAGKGTIGGLITDTTLSGKINQTIVRLEKISDSAAVITGDISHLISDLKQGKGTAGILLNDTLLIYQVNKSLQTIEKGAGNFNENMARGRKGDD